MLIECAHHIERRGGNPKNLTLHGQEKNLGTWAICKMNALLHGFSDAHIEKGDTIRDPKLVKDGVLQVYDRVIANPPFSLDEWGREFAEHDPYGRFHYGLPPKGKGDLAFVQHMVAILDKHGQLGVVMPHGILFRGGVEGDIRKGLLKDDLVEAVIGLPSNLFYGTGIPAAVLVLNKDKKPERQGKVIFIEASREFREANAQNYLRDEDVAKIAAKVPRPWRVGGRELRDDIIDRAREQPPPLGHAQGDAQGELELGCGVRRRQARDLMSAVPAAP